MNADEIVGEIYSALNIKTNTVVALKVEKVDAKKQSLQCEVAALRCLQGLLLLFFKNTTHPEVCIGINELET